MVRILKNWGPVVGWCGVIFGMSAIPSLSTGWGVYDTILRKMAHMVEFALLAALVWRALRHTAPLPARSLFLYSFLFAAIYAFSDEWHQAFVPGRTPAFTDVGFDSVGALTICVLQKKWGTDAFGQIGRLFQRMKT
jgi:hypothetical protein